MLTDSSLFRASMALPGPRQLLDTSLPTLSYLSGNKPPGPSQLLFHKQNGGHHQDVRGSALATDAQSAWCGASGTNPTWLMIM